MARKLIFSLSLLLLAAALTGSSFASAVEIDLGFSTTGNVLTGNSGAHFTATSGFAYQGANVGTYSLTSGIYSGTGCSAGCALTGGPQTLTVDIGTDILVGTLALNSDTAGVLLEGPLTIVSSTPGFTHTGYTAGAVVTTHFVISGGKISVAEIETDTPPGVPEPGTMAMMGSGLLAVAGVLRRKLF